MSRVLAFFLGMIFGIVFLLGSLGLGVYLAVTKVTPADISQETAVLGDLANMSLLDIYKNLSTLYSQKIGVADQNGKYYSLGDLCTQYNIDSQNLFGVSLSDDLLEVPVFEFFSATTDSQGNNGVQRALKQIKVSAIPSLLNLFVKNEDGSAIVNDNVMEELSNYNIVELMTKEQGIAYVFENITFSQLLPENFPSDPNGDNALMWAVGQSSVGKLYTALGSNDSLFLQLKDGGALETLGQMEVTDLLGSEAGTLSSLFGDTLVVDLVGENGEINVDDIINYTYVGSLLGCIRNEITDVSGYHVLASSPNGDVLYGIIDGKDSLVKEEDGKYYEAELTCTEQHDVHGYDCYGFVWYNSSVLPSDHPCTPDEELIKDGLHHSKVSSLYGAFVNLRIADITGGSFDAILDKVKNLTISEIVNGEVSGILANFADMTVGELLDGGFENFYLGSLLGCIRNEITDTNGYNVFATSENGTVWVKTENEKQHFVKEEKGKFYEAELTCTQEHTHTADCYGFVWYNSTALSSDHDCNPDEELIENGVHHAKVSSLYGALVNLKVSDLTGGSADAILEKLKDLTISDIVNGEVSGLLANFADMTINELLNGGLEGMYLGSLLGCLRKVADTNGYLTIDGVEGVLQNNGKFIRQEGDVWYEAKLDCTESHAHTADCYGFVWYNSTPLDAGHACNPNEELIENGVHYAKVTSLYGALVNLKVSDLTGGSADAILNKVKGLTIADIVNGEVSGVLANFADMSLGELLDGGLEDMYLGNFLGYTRTQTDATQVTGVATLDDGTKVGFANGNTVMSDDGKTWYLAQQTCEQHADHTRDCYRYVWTDGSAAVEGLMAKFADKKVNSLGDMSDMLQQLTLAEVLGEENLTGIFRQLANVPIGQISAEIDNIYIGTVLEYTRKQVADISGYTAVDDVADVLQNNGEFVRKDGDVWYEAKLDCTESHVHNSDCYGFVWYTDETCVQAVSGLEAMLSNATINTIGDRLKLENFTLAKLGIGCDNNILAYLQDVPLSEIDTQLNTMKLGVALGYTLNNENVWVDGEGNPVKGINAKIAEMSIQDFGSGNGITEITNTLTIGDLMDSGMIVLDEDKKYKLNIIFCNDEDQSFTENNGIIPYEYKCNIIDYIAYLNNGHKDDATPAQDFYGKFTHGENCSAQWKEMQLTVFIASLLSAF